MPSGVYKSVASQLVIVNDSGLTGGKLLTGKRLFNKTKDNIYMISIPIHIYIYIHILHLSINVISIMIHTSHQNAYSQTDPSGTWDINWQQTLNWPHLNVACHFKFTNCNIHLALSYRLRQWVGIWWYIKYDLVGLPNNHCDIISWGLSIYKKIVTNLGRGYVITLPNNVCCVYSSLL